MNRRSFVTLSALSLTGSPLAQRGFAETANSAARVWRTDLSHRHEEVPAGNWAQEYANARPDLIVDENRRYQQMLGFGAAFTDASCISGWMRYMAQWTGLHEPELSRSLCRIPDSTSGGIPHRRSARPGSVHAKRGRNRPAWNDARMHLDSGNGRGVRARSPWPWRTRKGRNCSHEVMAARLKLHLMETSGLSTVGYKTRPILGAYPKERPPHSYRSLRYQLYACSISQSRWRHCAGADQPDVSAEHDRWSRKQTFNVPLPANSVTTVTWKG